VKFHKLFGAEGLPVFQNKMYVEQQEAINCPKGNIELVQNHQTGLIYNAAFDPKSLEYDKDYQNEQAHSNVFKNHLEDVKLIINKYFKDRTAIEVGCGKGYFLEFLNQAGYEVTGVDPAYEGNNPAIIREYFDESLELSSRNIVLRHVLEHIVDPFVFLSSIAEANHGEGLIYIEVPCLDWICEHKAWFDIFYEHVNYFRLVDFQRMFGRIYESGHVFGGQYLYVVADLASLKIPVCSSDDIFNLPPDFMSGIKEACSLANGSKNVVWGGASKGVIFSLYMQRNNIIVDYLIDINPAKQGKYVGVTGLKVLSPKNVISELKTGNNIFVMNSNYLEEIMALSDNKFNYIKVD